MRLCGFGCLFHFFTRSIRFAKGDIVSNRAGEEEDILLDDRDLFAQGSQVPVAHVDTVHQHLSPGDIVGAVDELDQ